MPRLLWWQVELVVPEVSQAFIGAKEVVVERFWLETPRL
jgi:hypothetical protein